MSLFKKLLAVGVAVLALSAVSVTALAASVYSSPAEAVAGLTGRTVDSVVKERQDTGNTYGTIASEAGVLDEFKSAILELKKDVLDARVASGDMTQAQADKIFAAIQANMATCDGTGGAMLGQQYGVGFGKGSGRGYDGQYGQHGVYGCVYSK
ncbi:DUF2680 domain-containing protein [Oscillospiraceae bacterium CM]|nr:DUF2680 domain-containing protein [Oscillospiraceae bacterium CM]